MSAVLSEAKRFSNLQASAALNGVAVERSTDDRDRPVYVVSRWAFVRTVASLDDVEELLRALTGGAPG